MKYSIDEIVESVKEILPSDNVGFKTQVEKIIRKAGQHLESKEQLQQATVMCRAGDFVKEAGGDWMKVLKVDGSNVYLDYEDGLNALHIDDIIAWRHGT